MDSNPSQIILNNFFIIPTLLCKACRSNSGNSNSMSGLCLIHTCWIIYRLQIGDIFTIFSIIFLAIFAIRKRATSRTRKIPRLNNFIIIKNNFSGSGIYHFCNIWRTKLISKPQITLKRIWIVTSIVAICIIFAIFLLHIKSRITTRRHGNCFNFFRQIPIRNFTQSFQIIFHRQMIDNYQFSILVKNFNCITENVIVIAILLIPIRFSRP